MQAYLASSQADKTAMAPLEGLKACGIEDSREMVEWFWITASPRSAPTVPQSSPGRGISKRRRAPLPHAVPARPAIGEQFNLEELAVDCAADKRYEFMLVSVPINLEGGIASPPNAVAIK